MTSRNRIVARRVLVQCLAWVVAAFGLVSPAIAANPPKDTAANASVSLPSFSADQIHTLRGRTTTGKVYAAGSALRTETADKGKKSIVIMRFDRQVMWTLMPDQRMYIEMPWSNSGEWAAAVTGAQTKRESLGTERVGAYTCERSRVQTTLNGQSSVYFEWAAKELNGFVVKKQDEKGSWSTEYQNVQLGPQDSSLFELPAGYKKFSMGSMLPQH